jgi:hypothetical protein
MHAYEPHVLVHCGPPRARIGLHAGVVVVVRFVQALHDRILIRFKPIVEQ